MNTQKKLALSKETLRSLDDEDLTGVVGGGGQGKQQRRRRSQQLQLLRLLRYLRQLPVPERRHLRQRDLPLAGLATA